MILCIVSVRPLCGLYKVSLMMLPGDNNVPVHGYNSCNVCLTNLLSSLFLLFHFAHEAQIYSKLQTKIWIKQVGIERGQDKK